MPGTLIIVVAQAKSPALSDISDPSLLRCNHQLAERNTDGREKHRPVASHEHPDGGTSLQLRQVPWPEIEPTAFSVYGMVLPPTETPSQASLLHLSAELHYFTPGTCENFLAFWPRIPCALQSATSLDLSILRVPSGFSAPHPSGPVFSHVLAFVFGPNHRLSNASPSFKIHFRYHLPHEAALPSAARMMFPGSGVSDRHVPHQSSYIASSWLLKFLQNRDRILSSALVNT